MRATIVSTLPFAIETDRKPGLIPGVFTIPAAPKGGYSTVVIPDCVEIRAIPLMPEAIRTMISGVDVAEAVVNDYLNASMAMYNTPAFDGSIAVPGIFVIPAEVTAVVIEKEYKSQVTAALANTKAWFQRLIVLADDDWSKNHQRKTILDLQRVACSFLNLSREWNADTLIQDSSNCPACNSNVSPSAILCANCKFVLNKSKYDAMKGQFATA